MVHDSQLYSQSSSMILYWISQLLYQQNSDWSRMEMTDNFDMMEFFIYVEDKSPIKSLHQKMHLDEIKKQIAMFPLQLIITFYYLFFLLSFW